MTAISVPAPKLREMLEAVLPHADRDDTLPVLAAVRFEVRDGRLFLVATDRYTLGVARCQIPGCTLAPVADCAAMVPIDFAVHVATELGKAGGSGIAVIAFGDGELTVDPGDGAPAGSSLVPGKCPDWRSMLHAILAGEPADLGERFGIDRRHLAKLTTGITLEIPGEPDDYTWYNDDADSEPEPVLVRVLMPADNGLGSTWGQAPALVAAREDWFISALMMMRAAPGEQPELPWDLWTGITQPAGNPEPVTAATS